MYRVFEALDELVTILEEARGVPMTSGCVVPRGDVLELLDEVRTRSRASWTTPRTCWTSGTS